MSQGVTTHIGVSWFQRLQLKATFCPQTGKRKTHEKVAKSGVPSKSGREKFGAAKDGGKQPTEEDMRSKRIAGV